MRRKADCRGNSIELEGASQLDGTHSRRDAVADLVHLHKSLDASIAALSIYPWDSEEELLTLGPPEVRHVLGLFLEGRMSEDDLERWANAVESREDICFHPKNEIIDLVTELANPLLFTRLTRDSVTQMIGRLNDVDPKRGERGRRGGDTSIK